VLVLARCRQRWARTVAGLRHACRGYFRRRPAAAHAGGIGTDLLRSRTQLLAEHALLRHQVIMLRRNVKRPAVTATDRTLLVLLASRVRAWRHALLIVQPDTLLRWHRAGFRAFWRRRSRPGPGRPPLPTATVALIRRMAREKPRWGAERIRGALQQLGVRVAKRTIQPSLPVPRLPRPRGQPWATFRRHHAPDAWAGDFLPVTDARFRPLYACFVSALGARRVVHVGVTRHPTAAWVAQQPREATPFEQHPRYRIRDNDRTYGQAFARVAETSGITILRTAYRAPTQNALCERFLGRVRRECTDHLRVLGEGHLRRVLRAYVAYCNRARPHQGIGQATPEPSAGETARRAGPLCAAPVLGGLHHAYRRAA